MEISRKVLGTAALAWVGSALAANPIPLANSVVRTKLKERHGAHVPLDEPVISPAAMFQSPRLSTIADR
jgi:hypothetical protein